MNYFDDVSEPSQWDKDFPVCGGQNQSPINIVAHKARHDPHLTPIIFEGYTQTLNVTVQNLGNTGETAISLFYFFFYFRQICVSWLTFSSVITISVVCLTIFVPLVLIRFLLGLALVKSNKTLISCEAYEVCLLFCNILHFLSRVYTSSISADPRGGSACHLQGCSAASTLGSGWWARLRTHCRWGAVSHGSETTDHHQIFSLIAAS